VRYAIPQQAQKEEKDQILNCQSRPENFTDHKNQPDSVSGRPLANVCRYFAQPQVQNVWLPEKHTTPS